MRITPPAPRVLCPLNASEGSHRCTTRRFGAGERCSMLLVVLSLLLLTAYFGEAPGGRLHGVQRDIPDGRLADPGRRQQGAEARARRVRLVRRNARTPKASVTSCASRSTNCAANSSPTRPKNAPTGELLALYHLDQLGIGEYHPVTATVVGKSPNIWYSTVTIDKGEAGGRARQRPVDQRRRPRRQGRAGGARRRPGGPDHRQHDGRLGADRHEQDDRDRAAEGGRPERPAAPVPARQHAGRRAANTWSPRAPSPAATNRCTRRGS